MIRGLKTKTLSSFEASVVCGGILSRMLPGKPIKIAFGRLKDGDIGMLLSQWQSPQVSIANDTTLRLQHSLTNGFIELKRETTLEVRGNARHINGIPPMLQAKDAWLPAFPLPRMFVGGNPHAAMHNFQIPAIVAEAGNFVIQFSGGVAPKGHLFGRMQPCRLVPVHTLHERSVLNAYPQKSRLPEYLRSGAAVQFNFEKLYVTLDKTRFGRAVQELAQLNVPSPPSCQVLQEFALARPVFRCMVRIAEELLPGMQIDTCIKWSVKDGCRSEIEKAYAGTEFEHYEYLYSESELRGLLSAFFVPAIM